MGHYALALSHWLRGQETLALAFLFIGMETLVPVALDRECARLGVTPEALMNAWAIRSDDPPAVRRNKLNGAVRQRLLFRGDTELAATLGLFVRVQETSPLAIVSPLIFRYVSSSRRASCAELRPLPHPARVTRAPTRSRIGEWTLT